MHWILQSVRSTIAEMLALALRNPTVRKLFVVSRQVLESCDHLELQELLLEVLSARELSDKAIRAHFDQLRSTIKEASVAANLRRNARTY